jgi:hypothetical protein
MITRISASFLGGTVRQCAEMAVNRALIPLSGVIAAYREQPTHQLGTLSQREFLVVSLASSAAIFSSVRGRASWPIRQRPNAELHHLPLGIPSNVRQGYRGRPLHRGAADRNGE